MMRQKISRRSLLLGTSMSVVTRLCQARSEQAQFKPPDGVELAAPLKTHASRKGLLYGGAALQRHLEADPEYAALFANQCGVLVPEGELKWNALRPTPDSFNFGPADWLYEFTRSHNMKFRGHTLLWFQALPAWFNSYVNTGNAKKLLEDHVTRVVGHYSGKMHSWDVVNEVVNPYDKRSDGLQAKPWLELAGPEYIDLAFESARAADKSALLVWNENHLEINDKWSIAKRAALLSLLKEKLRRKIPIEAVGLQSHLSTNNQSFNSEEFRNFVKAIVDLGLKIIISELDVIDHDAPSSIASRDQMVAETYNSFLNSMLKQPSVIAVLTWGLGDKYSWLAKFKPREDGLPVRPLPFDESLAGKPAWTATANAFDAAPVRH
jgi:endo-1,4-beta-xylanase